MRDDAKRIMWAVDELSGVWAEFALGDISQDELQARTRHATATISILYAAKGTEATDAEIDKSVARLVAHMEAAG